MATSSTVASRKQAIKDGPKPDVEVLKQQPQEFAMTQLWDGTGFIAQAALITFAVSLGGRILTRPLMLFSWHPLSQIFGLILLLQSILVLQPTHTAGQKRVGQAIHAYLNGVSFVLFSGGFVVIYLNKERNKAEHFTTIHGSLGCVVTLSLWIQYIGGFSMWAIPGLYGGEARARAVWKYHRIGGYVNLVLLLATICTAAGTGFVRNVLKIEAWAFYAPMALAALGVLPRIHAYKLGLAKTKAKS